MRRLLTVILLASSSAAWANIAAVNLDNLAGFDLIQPDVQYLREHSAQFDHWSQTWPYRESKADCVALLKAASLRIEALRPSVPDQIDLTLLLLEVYQYRYNLDDNAVLEPFMALVAEAETRFADDYRPLWIDAVFQTNRGRAGAAVEKFQRILPSSESLSNVHPALLLDYAQACYLGTMLRTAKIALTVYLDKTGQTKAQVPLVGAVEERLVRPDLGAEYKPEEVWRVSQGSDGVRFSSTLWSAAFTVPGDWGCQMGGYKGGQSVSVLTPPPLKSKLGKTITIHLVLIQSSKEQAFADFVTNFERSLGAGYRFSRSPIKLPPAENGQADRVTNPNLYPDRNGMAGYALFLSREASWSNGYNLDRAADLPKSDKQRNYYQVNTQLDTVSGPVNTLLLVDSCQEIADETDGIVEAFLGGLRVR